MFDYSLLYSQVLEKHSMSEVFSKYGNGRTVSSGMCGIVQLGEDLEEDHGKGEAFDRRVLLKNGYLKETGLKFQVGSLG